MNDMFNPNYAASTSRPSSSYSPDSYLQVPAPFIGRRTVSPISDGSQASTPSSARPTSQCSHDSEGEQPLPLNRKRKRGNKKPPVGYPHEMQELVCLIATYSYVKCGSNSRPSCRLKANSFLGVSTCLVSNLSSLQLASRV